MAALAFAVQAIKTGDAQFVLAGGVESMSSAPYVLKTARWGQRLTHGEMTDAMWEMLHSGSNLLEKKGYIMGQTAENLAEKYAISRQDQDLVALRSHNHAEAAIKGGKFKEEIVAGIPPPEERAIPKSWIPMNMSVYGLTMADLERLAPAFKKDGTVTAGNSSGLNDGAAAVIVTSRAKAQEMEPGPHGQDRGPGGRRGGPQIDGLRPGSGH